MKVDLGTCECRDLDDFASSLEALAEEARLVQEEIDEAEWSGETETHVFVPDEHEKPVLGALASAGYTFAAVPGLAGSDWPDIGSGGPGSWVTVEVRPKITKR